MPQRLPSVLSSTDLPFAELQAARLDGQLARLGDCFVPVDEIQQPSHRALVVHSALPITVGDGRRMIAEQRSAAWVWGALEHPPQRHQFCVAVDSRTGRDLPHTVAVREVVIDAVDVAFAGGLRVTTPLRTVIDIARFSEEFAAGDQLTVSTLLREFGISVDRCVAEMNRRRNLPGKNRARSRLSRC